MTEAEVTPAGEEHVIGTLHRSGLRLAVRPKSGDTYELYVRHLMDERDEVLGSYSGKDAAVLAGHREFDRRLGISRTLPPAREDNRL
ncbi:MAG: hypothetical protein HY329_00600 [Chloroflexi bacterium]|nr:hypothetical protein [Chloroflexota bacterium]